MKYVAMFALLATGLAYADGPTDIHGFNENGEEIRAYAEGHFPVEGGTVDAYTVNVRKPGQAESEGREEYTMQHCGVDARVSYKPGFFCDRTSGSPLSGSRYSFVKYLPGCRGSLLTCQSGCGPRAPRELVINPWECDGEEEIAKTDAHRGFVAENNVDLREMASARSTVLREVLFGTKVKVLKQDAVCKDKYKRQGLWTNVIVLDEKTTTGWICDTYIAYQYLTP